jgi:hypothetical protein
MRIVCFGAILKGCSHSFHACKHGGRLPLAEPGGTAAAIGRFAVRKDVTLVGPGLPSD